MTLSWKLSLIVLLFVPIIFFTGTLSEKGVKEKKGGNISQESGRILIESVENIRTVVALGREQYVLKEMSKLYKKGYHKNLLKLHLRAIFYSVANTTNLFLQITTFAFGWELMKNDGLKTSDLYKCYSMLTLSFMVLGRSFSQIPDQTQAHKSTKETFKIIDRVSKIDSMSEEGLKPDKIIGDIEFKNVDFSYAGTPAIKILQNFSLSIKNGETNAFVGQSGCGKSTTITLLLRFYDVSAGIIELDGINIKNLNIQWLRKQIGLVSQEPVLYDYKIKENIMDGNLDRDDISLDEVIQAAKDSNIHSRIENLPENYDTKVGVKGGQLSGGEKQRIAIARAMIRKPAILLLDEATSALDTESEKIVQDALDKAQLGRTCIVIAHRLSTIENSDKICVIEKGFVAEEGTHEELMDFMGLYFILQNPILSRRGSRRGSRLGSRRGSILSLNRRRGSKQPKESDLSKQPPQN